MKGLIRIKDKTLPVNNAYNNLVKLRKNTFIVGTMMIKRIMMTNPGAIFSPF